MRVNWMLVWCSVFVAYYPLTEFGVRIMRPSAYFMPAWMFAGCQAFGWTYLIWSVRNRPRKNARRVPPQRPDPKWKLWIAASVVILGMLARIWGLRLSGVEIFSYAVLIPLSYSLAGYLAERSGLGRAQQGATH